MTELQKGPNPALRSGPNEYTWTAFPERPSTAKGSLKEGAIFKQLESIVEAVKVAALELHPTLVQHFFYKNNPNRTPASSHRNISSRSDGYFMLYNPSRLSDDSKPEWRHIGPVGEFKREDDENAEADVCTAFDVVHICGRC